MNKFAVLILCVSFGMLANAKNVAKTQDDKAGIITCRGLRVVDAKGRTRIELAWNDVTETASVALYDKELTAATTIYISEDAQGIDMERGSSLYQNRMKKNGDHLIEITDERNKKRYRLFVGGVGHQDTTRLSLMDPEGRERVTGQAMNVGGTVGVADHEGNSHGFVGQQGTPKTVLKLK